MATFTGIGPINLSGVGVFPGHNTPALPTYTSVGAPVGPPVSGHYIPITPLPAVIGGFSSFAMGLAPLALPFVALLSWWLK